MLIAAVRRVFEPGCYHKEMVVLHGSQDAGKSQWIRKLAGDEWFNDSLHISGKTGLTRDDKEMIRRFWIHEIAEMDKLYSKADDAALKSLISSPSDNFRMPYAVDTEAFPRMSIFIGTTNREDILKDPTGESRFLVIPVEKAANEIDLKMIEDEKNTLWATAYHLYLQGEQHWLTPDEKGERKQSNERFVETDEWFELIRNYLENYQTSNISVIMIDCLGLTDKKDFNTTNSKKIVDILNKLGWKPKGDKKISGKVLKQWGCSVEKENALNLVDSFERIKHILYPSDVKV
jgi:predicted P-loop ATPase